VRLWKRKPNGLGPNPEWVGNSNVVFKNSVGGGKGSWEYLAGREYGLIAEKADEFIIKGYATGTLSRHYDTQEKQELLAKMQRITFG